MKVLVLHAEQRQWKDRWFREVQYFEPIKPKQDEGCKGVLALKVSGTEESMVQLLAQPLPAVFDVEFGARPNFKGDPETVLVGAKHLKAVKVSDVVPS